MYNTFIKDVNCSDVSHVTPKTNGFLFWIVSVFKYMGFTSIFKAISGPKGMLGENNRCSVTHRLRKIRTDSPIAFVNATEISLGEFRGRTLLTLKVKTAPA